MEKILLIHEVAALLRVAVSTVRRWRGKGNFPVPISPPSGKLRWRESDIIRFIETQSTPPANTPSVPSPTKQGKDKKQRLEAARAALERHKVKK